MHKELTRKLISREKVQKLPLLPVFVCVLAGFAVTMVCTLLLVLIVWMVDMPPAVTEVFTLVSLLLGALVCGKVCARKFPKERGLMALICGLAATILLVVLNLLLYFEPVTAISFVKYAVIIVGTFLGAAFTDMSNGKKKSKRKV